MLFKTQGSDQMKVRVAARVLQLKVKPSLGTELCRASQNNSTGWLYRQLHVCSQG